MDDQVVLQGLCGLGVSIAIIWGCLVYASDAESTQKLPRKRQRFKSEKTDQEKRWEENAR